MSNIIKKRIKVFLLFFILVIISLILVIISKETQFLGDFGYHTLKGFRSDIGIAGTVGLGIAIALFFIRLIMRYYNDRGLDKVIKGLNKIKIGDKLIPVKKVLLKEKIMKPIKLILSIFQTILQKFHIPLALAGLSVITYHVYMAFYMGWEWKIGYIFGFIAYVFLVLLTLSGILRMFNKNIKGHKYIAFAALIFTVLHIVLI